MRRLLLLSALCALLFICHPALAAETFEAHGRKYVVANDPGEKPAESWSAKLFLTKPDGRKRMAGMDVLFAADRLGNGYRFAVDAKGWALTSIAADGSARKVAHGSGKVLPASGDVELLIKRRAWLLTVAVAGRVVCEVADKSHTDGVLAFDASLSYPAQDEAGALRVPIVQAIGDIAFHDGFMRPTEEMKGTDHMSLDLWSIASGTWKGLSVRASTSDMPWWERPASKQPEAEKSANPFSLVAYAETTGLIFTKADWFWDDFEAGVAVRNLGAKALGFAFNVVAPDDYFLLSWDGMKLDRRPTCIRMLRVRGDKTTELTSAWVAGQLGQWYQLSVKTHGQHIRVFLDEAEIMRADHAESLGGRLGLFVAGGTKHKWAMFDEVSLKRSKSCDFDSRMWLASHAQATSGCWRTRTVPRTNRPDNTAVVLDSPDGSLLVGHPGWRPPIVRARLSRPAPDQRIGIETGVGVGTTAWRMVLENHAGSLNIDLISDSNAAETDVAIRTTLPPSDDPFINVALDMTRPGECNVYVDDKLVLHAPCPNEVAGAVRLFAINFPGAEIRDLNVTFQRADDLESLPINKAFKDDPFMQHWSSDKGAWWPDTQGSTFAAALLAVTKRWRHVGDFYGRSDVTLPLNNKLIFIHASGGKVLQKQGYALVLAQVVGAGYELTLLRNGTPVAGGTAPVDATTVELHKEGPYIWVTSSGQELLSFRDPAPLTDTRASLITPNAAALEQVKVLRTNVRDEYFETAGTDWSNVGDWMVTTRFACNPSWSHMVGKAKQNAALYSKYRYEGDMTIECHMGMRMDAPLGVARGTYVRVGSLNLGMCARDRDPDSGYNFIVAGWDRHVSESRSYLLKGLKILAQSSERLLPNPRRSDTSKRVLPVPWIAPGRDIHGAWYYIKARKQAGKLSSYVDNHLVYEVEDPNPIEETTPTLWTYNTEVVVARLRLSFERRIVPGRLVPPPPSAGVAATPAHPAPIIVSPTHPGLTDDFEGGQRGWTTYSQHSGVLSIVTSDRPDHGHCLRVANRGPGGLFEALVPSMPTADPKKPIVAAITHAANVHELSFDYRLDPDVRINLYVRVDDQYYFIHMNGPDEESPFYRRLGELDIHADGMWHRAAFPLGDALRNLGKDGPVQLIAFGNLHRGALQMGLGGNGPDCAYYLDNFRIISRGGSEFSAACRAEDVPSDAVVLSAIDTRADTSPTAEGPMKSTIVGKPEGDEGTCHARVRLADGTLSAVARLPFIVVGDAVTLQSVSPPANGNWGYAPIVISTGNTRSGRVVPTSLALTINAKAVAPHPGLFHVDNVSRRITIDLARAALDIPDAGKLALALTYKTVGNLTVHSIFRATYTARAAADTTPPGLVVLADYMPTHDFETGMDGWLAHTDVALMRDRSTAASGDWSLMVHSNKKWRSSFLTYMQRKPLNTGNYPIIEFDYRFHPGVNLDMVVSGGAQGRQYTVSMTDRANKGRPTCLGEFSGFKADDRWHHTEFNLLKGIHKITASDAPPSINWIGIGDVGHTANALGAYYHVDNVRFVPLVKGKLSLEWSCHDAAGVAGYSHSWSAHPSDLPDETVDSRKAGAAFTKLPAGNAWLHIKAVDRNGNWGPVAHFRFLSDTLPPVVKPVTPRPGSKSAVGRLVVNISDNETVVDARTIRLSIDGRTFGSTDKGITYDPVAGNLTWDWLAARRDSDRFIPDRRKMQVSVISDDFAGNRTETKPWSWTMDYKSDTAPPPPPELNCLQVPVAASETFSKDMGAWELQNTRSMARYIQMRRMPRPDNAGNFCLQTLFLHKATRFTISAHKRQYDLTKYPLVSFDYCVPSGNVQVNMFVDINGKKREVKLTTDARFKLLGTHTITPNTKKWQHVVIDLLALVRKQEPTVKTFVVRSIEFGNAGAKPTLAGTTWRMDNFRIAGYTPAKANFTWRSVDITGIKSYAVAFDQIATTEPNKRAGLTSKSSGARFANKPGTWWLHVAACDGNKNWSKTTHIPYTIKKK